MTINVQAIQLSSRPQGVPTPDNFTFVNFRLSELGSGDILVENVYLSVDPYMRELMDAGWELNTLLEGRVIGRVLVSADPGVRVGDLVFHRASWRTHAVVAASEVRVLPQTPGVDATAYLGILGGTGLTAYVGLTQIARLQAGETVFISAAAGGVGSAAGQIARLLGAGRVIGSTGSVAKAKYLTEALGFDAAINYRDGDLTEQLHKAAPEGIDVYFDNVGGDHLAAAISVLRENGRVAF